MFFSSVGDLISPMVTKLLQGTQATLAGLTAFVNKIPTFQKKFVDKFPALFPEFSGEARFDQIGKQSVDSINNVSNAENVASPAIPARSAVDVSGALTVKAESGTSVTQGEMFNPNIGLNFLRPAF